ncbi:LysR family transcriptional regulator [Neiella marina]|uniref:LysR family transcriptional regulator n=1 Tax=Neiella holothuriorum TaxID=2870530 RepID=A0ABS7EEI1_9GAMM|nr:LysR family transcriptional regulator [Neiella holothuriorum]MBW8190723.1 LysR family transcriptional regulator [Neiella holothuriorum]
MIHPSYLRTFIELGKTKHFTRTAENLYMTQPGVSQHVKKLEQWLGKPLLHRDGKQFEFTEAGEMLLQFAQSQFRAEQSFRDSVHYQQTLGGHCKLACSGGLALQIYPLLLDIQQRYPDFRFSLEAAPERTIIREVKSGEIELGITSEVVQDAAISQQLFGSDELCLVVPQGVNGDWSTLKELGFINHPDGYQFATAVLSSNYFKEFSGMELLPERGFINQIGQILIPVSRGIGFTVVPRSAWQAFELSEQVDVVPLSSPVQQPLYWTHKRRKPLPQRYEMIIEKIELQVQSNLEK